MAAPPPLPIPDGGTQMLHHVHADDVAQAFERAVDRRPRVVGADLNIVSGSAMSARGFATIAAGWFGRSAVLEDVSWQQFRDATSAEDAELSWRHLHRSHYASIDKARRLLGYAPRFEPEDAVHQALRWLHDHHRLSLPLT
ncbi:NAD-dependent epimerase/dehydratase family protein [Acidipropionibacterium jensenii]|nr:hypothetical protein [Acidipropionibacterium jensenii]MDN5976269.1 hypothetical protein [Acidipropionibacterium jensenii]MDN5995336.1 hypothetical protein [Acidipropionibacterium jensenii]MDN6426593.1 hypothetical protein [Acidipropionibacterium jensenii]MDN6440710.1 hypothetical protein [Acidipropionibacterium jensenii]MDN6479622.1 hypothetical protein [Acidipropionibacterium jensenii]